MKTNRTNTVIQCITDDGWKYYGYRTTTRAPHHWAGERISPEGAYESLKVYPTPEHISELARQHEVQQRTFA